jgi:hypothetical protein
MTRQKGGILPEKATPSFFSCQSARDLPRSTASLAREGRDVKTCEGSGEGGEGKRRSKGRGNKEEATKVGQKEDEGRFSQCHRNIRRFGRTAL